MHDERDLVLDLLQCKGSFDSNRYALGGAFDHSKAPDVQKAFQTAMASSFHFLSGGKHVKLVGFGRASELSPPKVPPIKCGWKGTPGAKVCAKALAANKTVNDYEDCQTFTPAEQNAYLCQFNQERARHGSVPLEWDDNLAKVRQLGEGVLRFLPESYVFPPQLSDASTHIMIHPHGQHLLRISGVMGGHCAQKVRR